MQCSAGASRVQVIKRAQRKKWASRGVSHRRGEVAGYDRLEVVQIATEDSKDDFQVEKGRSTRTFKVVVIVSFGSF